MDDLDRAILNTIQRNFPVTSRPYLKIATELGTSETEVIERIKDLKKRGLIRRIGGIFDSKKLGYVSTLCAIKVPDDRIEEVTEVINSHYGVTHNYLRNHEYNMWFTYIAPSKEAIECGLQKIKEETKIHDLINLPAVNLFKINVNFSLREDTK